jgi:hypothetical protein
MMLYLGSLVLLGSVNTNVVRHLMQKLLFFILFFLFKSSSGQNFYYPSINTNGHVIADFVPSGWTIIDSTFGDLNNDNRNDAVIILQKKDSVFLTNSDKDTVLTQPRILLILFRNSMDTNLYVKEQDDSFILLNDNPNREDPYQAIRIKNGILDISFQLFYSFGSWYITSSSYKFRFQNNQFCLIGADYSSFHRATHDSQDYSYNFLSNKRSLIKETNGTKIKRIITWKKLNLTELKTLKTFTQPFSWNIEEEVLL